MRGPTPPNTTWKRKRTCEQCPDCGRIIVPPCDCQEPPMPDTDDTTDADAEDTHLECARRIDTDGDGYVDRLDLVLAKYRGHIPASLFEDHFPFPADMWQAADDGDGIPVGQFAQTHLRPNSEAADTPTADTSTADTSTDDDATASMDPTAARGHQLRRLRSHGSVTTETLARLADHDDTLRREHVQWLADQLQFGTKASRAAHACLEELDERHWPVTITEVYEA